MKRNYRRRKIAIWLLTVVFLLSASQAAVLATEQTALENESSPAATTEETGDGWNRTDPEISSSTTETTSNQDLTPSLHDSFADGPVTLTVTPGSTAEASNAVQLSDVGGDIEGFRVPAGLTGGSAEAPTQLTETTTDENGNSVETVTTAIYAEDGTTIIGYRVVTTTTEQTAGTVGDAEITTEETSETVQSAPAGFTVGTVAEGNRTVTTEAIYDESGETVIGYTVTTVTVTETDADTDTAPQETVRIELPERPAEPAPVTDEATGETTTVTVETVVEHGETVGYTVTTVVTDGNGSELSRSSETTYGQRITETVTVTGQETTETKVETFLGTTTTTTTRTTTQQKAQETTTRTVQDETWTLEMPEDGQTWTYTAQMSAVRNSSTVTASTLQSELASYVQDLENWAYNDAVMLQRHDYSKTPDPERYNDYDYQLYGMAVMSAVVANSTRGTWTGWLTYQYILQDASGAEHYVLCADLSTNPRLGTGYHMENVEDADYYTTEGAAAHIKAIALNGYWGTASGTGSLETVKQMLRSGTDLTEEQINSLTPGMALTATQAALWYYGNSGTSDAINYNTDLSQKYYSKGTSGQSQSKTLSAEQKAVLNGLCSYLVNLEPATVEDTGTTVLNADKFATGASITLKEKLTGDWYNTDIAFALGMVPAEQDDLVVTVQDSDGNVLAVRRLTGDGEEPQATATVQGDGIVYTLEDVELPAGAVVTLRLTGTQVLDEGVYLYSADAYTTSQTYVGVASGTRAVDLSVDLTLNTTAPQATLQHHMDSTVYTDTSTYVAWRVDTETDLQSDVATTNTVLTETADKTETRTNAVSLHTEDTWTPTPIETPTPPARPDTPVTPTPVETPEVPEIPLETPMVDVPEPEVPLAATPAETPVIEEAQPEEPVEVVETVEVPEDEVPLAAQPDTTPYTGDSSMIWLLLMVLSGAAVLGNLVDRFRS